MRPLAAFSIGTGLFAVSLAAVFAIGKAEGAREVRIATVVRVGVPVPAGPYFGVCAPIQIAAPGGSAEWTQSGRACASDQPEQSRDLPPGEVLSLGLSLGPAR